MDFHSKKGVTVPRVCIYLNNDNIKKLNELALVYPNYNRSALIGYLIWSRHKDVESGVKRINSYEETETA